MEHLPEFISNHWMLCSAFVFVTILIALNEWQQALASGSGVNPHQAVNLINRNDAVVLDIRSKDQFKNGHILNAHNVNNIEQAQRFKNNELIIACDTGAKSSAFAKELIDAGFDKVSTLKGGMQAWGQAELPTSNK